MNEEIKKFKHIEYIVRDEQMLRIFFFGGLRILIKIEDPKKEFENDRHIISKLKSGEITAEFPRSDIYDPNELHEAQYDMHLEKEPIYNAA